MPTLNALLQDADVLLALAPEELAGVLLEHLIALPADEKRHLNRYNFSLSPYSPDFNPIEQAFAKLKAFLRAARPRTFDHVCELMAAAIGLFTPTECANYVRHSGYRVATSL